MKYYVKLDGKENVYYSIDLYANKCYLVNLNTEYTEPVDGEVIGTVEVYWDAGYNYLTGTIYDETYVEFFNKR